MTTRTYTLSFDGITLDTSKLRMEKRGGKEVMDFFYLDENYTIQDDEIVDVDSLRKAIEESDECVLESIEGERTTLKVTLDLYDSGPPVIEYETLECMSSHMDGAHCGLGDWYPEIEAGIEAALKKGAEYRWTTGWYASKKEIASANISNTPDGICVEVSVSDDFDTPGLGSRSIAFTTDLEEIRQAIYDAWDDAEGNQKENRMYVGYSVHDATEGGGWVETYIKASGEGALWCGDSPPGDNYHTWGFQNEYDIPEDVKDQLEEWAQSNDWGSHTVGDFTIKGWDEDPRPKD